MVPSDTKFNNLGHRKEKMAIGKYRVVSINDARTCNFPDEFINVIYQGNELGEAIKSFLDAIIENDFVTMDYDINEFKNEILLRSEDQL